MLHPENSHAMLKVFAAVASSSCHRRSSERKGVQDAGRTTWANSCRPGWNRRCRRCTVISCRVKNSTTLRAPSGSGGGGGSGVCCRRRLGDWSLLGYGRLLLLLPPYAASYSRRNDNHEGYNGDNNHSFPCAVEGWVATSTLDVVSGPWRSCLFYQKVRVVITLSKFTVRFECEEH